MELVEESEKEVSEGNGLGPVIIAVVVGVLVFTAIYLVKQEESYSVLYLKPGSYSEYLDENRLSFAYGVEFFENKPTNYKLSIFLGNTLLDERDFSLTKANKRHEEEVELVGVPTDLKFPVKVRLLLKADDNEYEVHYWLKEAKRE
ncbi:MAG: hypothetical protein ABH950_04980 [Candidatus Altiarchaeota archaeon]